MLGQDATNVERPRVSERARLAHHPARVAGGVGELVESGRISPDRRICAPERHTFFLHMFAHVSDAQSLAAPPNDGKLSYFCPFVPGPACLGHPVHEPSEAL